MIAWNALYIWRVHFHPLTFCGDLKCHRICNWMPDSRIPFFLCVNINDSIRHALTYLHPVMLICLNKITSLGLISSYKAIRKTLHGLKANAVKLLALPWYWLMCSITTTIYTTYISELTFTSNHTFCKMCYLEERK